jgi:GNAT superfamily N-acetyltransferase
VRQLVLAHVDERISMPGIEHMRADAIRLPGPTSLRVARSGSHRRVTIAIGCVALRPLPGGIGEVKRMYVDRAWRGKGVGRALLETLIAHARTLGYHHLRLGTVAEMSASAVALPHARLRADRAVSRGRDGRYRVLRDGSRVNGHCRTWYD